MVRILETSNRGGTTYYHIIYSSWVMHNGHQYKSRSYETWCKTYGEAKRNIEFQAKKSLGIPKDDYVFINLKSLIEVFEGGN